MLRHNTRSKKEATPDATSTPNLDTLKTRAVTAPEPVNPSGLRIEESPVMIELQRQLDTFNIPIDVYEPAKLANSDYMQRVVSVAADPDDEENIFFVTETTDIGLSTEEKNFFWPERTVLTAEALRHISDAESPASSRPRSALFEKMAEFKDKKLPLKIFSQSRTQAARNEFNPSEDQKPNEDRILQSNENDVFGVIDGMGGHKGGAKAAEIARDACLNFLRKNTNVSDAKRRLKEVIGRANDLVEQQSHEDPANYEGMGAVLSFAQIVEQADGKYLAWASVGDTRVYVKNSEGLGQKTTDECAGRYVTNCIGANHFQGIKYENIGAIKLEPGMRILICSDGIVGDEPWQELSKDEIASALEIDDPDEALKELFRISRKNDDTTGLIIDVVPDNEAIVKQYVMACNNEFAGSTASLKPKKQQPSPSDTAVSIIKEAGPDSQTGVAPLSWEKVVAEFQEDYYSEDGHRTKEILLENPEAASRLTEYIAEINDAMTEDHEMLKAFSKEFFEVIIATALQNEGKIALNRTFAIFFGPDKGPIFESDLQQFYKAWEQLASKFGSQPQKTTTASPTPEVFDDTTEPEARNKSAFELISTRANDLLGINSEKIRENLENVRATAKQDLGIIKERAEKLYTDHKKEVMVVGAVVGAIALGALVRRSKRR